MCCFLTLLSGSVFQSFARPGGIGGPDTKNQGQHEPIEMKFCASHYSHKSMPDAKFESGAFIFYSRYDVTKFLSEEGNDLSNSNSPWKMGLNLKRKFLMSRIVLLDPKLTPPPVSISVIFRHRKIFLHFQNERAAASPPPKKKKKFGQNMS